MSLKGEDDVIALTLGDLEIRGYVTWKDFTPSDLNLIRSAIARKIWAFPTAAQDLLMEGKGLPEDGSREITILYIWCKLGVEMWNPTILDGVRRSTIELRQQYLRDGEAT